MDKFDDSIKRAKQTYESKNNFVEGTMHQINQRQPRKRWNIKIWVPMFAGGLAVIALVLIILPNGNHFATQKPMTGQAASQSVATTSASGADNVTLTSDLNNINGAVNQENSDQNSANAAINDSTQQVIVPTD